MTPLDSIKEGVAHALDSRGRRARAAYGRILPVGLLLPVAVAARFQWRHRDAGRGRFCLARVFAGRLPLLNTTRRRLIGAGETDGRAYMPFVLWAFPRIGRQFALWGSPGMAVPGRIRAFALRLRAAALSFLLPAAALITRLMIATAPRTVSDGPNPHEVPT